MQISARNSLYKSSLLNLDFGPIQPQTPTDGGNAGDTVLPSFFGSTADLSGATAYSGASTGERLDDTSDIKEIYEKMEFDAMRYNRNFDTRTGAERI